MTAPSPRDLPSVNTLLAHGTLLPFVQSHGRAVVRAHVRAVLDAARAALRSEGHAPHVCVDELAERVRTALTFDLPNLRPVINATGILLHTGLGRAPLGPVLASSIAEAAAGYCSLEFNLDDGTRGHRTSAVEALLSTLTGAEAATVVNNNAAATLLALKTLAYGREVIVSRGQLVEIGGSYRLPEVMEAAGVRLREVGTTNRTRLADYARAIGPETAAILRVHTSNYRVIGFTEDVPIVPLAELAHAHSLRCIDDIGSGALSPNAPGIPNEPNIADSLAVGADLVLCSGDKLLGGPQSGLLLGRRSIVDQLRANPLMRALRVDKLTLAALETLLRAARDPDRARAIIPLWALLDTPCALLAERAERLCASWSQIDGLTCEVCESQAYLGGGAAPMHALASVAVRLVEPLPAPQCAIADFARTLRRNQPAIIPRVHENALLLDLRSVFPHQDDALDQAIHALLQVSGRVAIHSNQKCE